MAWICIAPWWILVLERDGFFFRFILFLHPLLFDASWLYLYRCRFCIAPGDCFGPGQRYVARFSKQLGHVHGLFAVECRPQLLLCRLLRSPRRKVQVRQQKEGGKRMQHDPVSLLH